MARDDLPGPFPEHDPEVIAVRKSAGHAIMLGLPFLLFGALGVAAGVTPLLQATAPYTIYYVILGALGVPALVLGVWRVAGREVVAIDRRRGAVFVRWQSVWWTTERAHALDDVVSVTMVKVWNPSKTESAYFHRVVLRGDASSGIAVLLETRMTEEAARRMAEEVGRFIDRPVLQEKGWR